MRPEILAGAAMVGVIGLLALGSSTAAAAPRVRPAGPPTGEAVVGALQHLAIPLPRPGHAYLVVIVNRTHGLNADLPDPWDDWLGILRSDGRRLHWRCALGSGEPGWLPMWGRGDLPTAAKGCSRLAAPQLATDAYGGGYHRWDTARPAFRQVGPVMVERFNAESGRWEGPLVSTGSHNNHSTEPATDWQRTRRRGVRDWSHGCPVVLDPAEHRRNLAAGGWTPAVDGVRLSLVTLDISHLERLT